jgi:isoquinoline 1-oxidoreductase subunit beta
MRLGQAAREGRGVSMQSAFGCKLAQVAEVEVQGNAVRVERVVCAIGCAIGCAFGCGLTVNPDAIHAQLQLSRGLQT